MRIAMFSWESMHSIAIGGLAPHITELSTALGRRGHEVHIFTRVGERQSGYDCIQGVHYHRCPFEPHADFPTYVERMNDSFVWRFGETEHFLGAPFDVVHGHDWLATRALRDVKNTRHRPTVLTIHSTEFGRCGNSLWDDPMSHRIRQLEWEGTYLADRVICVSKALAAETMQWYSTPADKVFAVYNGVDVRKYDRPVNVPEVRRKHAVGAADPMVLFAGRLTWQKGPDILLEALPTVLAEHPDAKFVFAGDGDMRLGLEQRASSNGLSSATRFLGHRNGIELVGLFHSSDVVCVPSRNEPFGIVILEAWSASKPVVATRTGGPAEFVQDLYSGVTVECDVEPIGRGLRSLLADTEAAREMGRNGRREAESRFTWDHSAAATERVYESLGNPDYRQNHDLVEQALEEAAEMAQQTPSRSVRHNGDRTNGIKKGTGPTATIPPAREPTHEQIKLRAYQIYLARKGAPGNPMADWLQAEREIRERFAAEAADRKRRAK